MKLKCPPVPSSEYCCPAAGVEATKGDTKGRKPSPPPHPYRFQRMPLALDSCQSDRNRSRHNDLDNLVPCRIRSETILNHLFE